MENKYFFFTFISFPYRDWILIHLHNFKIIKVTNPYIERRFLDIFFQLNFDQNKISFNRIQFIPLVAVKNVRKHFEHDTLLSLANKRIGLCVLCFDKVNENRWMTFQMQTLWCFSRLTKRKRERICDFAAKDTRLALVYGNVLAVEHAKQKYQFASVRKLNVRSEKALVTMWKIVCHPYVNRTYEMFK